MRSASAASIIAPLMHSSSARARPTRRSSRCVPPKPGMTPSLTSGWPKLRRLAGVDEVAGQRDLAAAAEREAVDRRDHRDRQRGQLLAQRVALAGELAGLVLPHRRHRGDVGPGHEGLAARAGDDRPQPPDGTSRAAAWAASESSPTTSTA
jgi:hypothetical protein